MNKEQIKSRNYFIPTVILLMLVVSEIVLRMLGYTPYKPIDNKIQSNPHMCLISDCIMGIRLNPGSFDVTINDKLKHHVTHTDVGTRITGEHDRLKDTSLVRIDFYGCSFTYGMGVNNPETYPYLLQETFRQLDLRNYGVPGYGQVQMLLQLENSIKTENKPDYLILNYLSFHNERNAMNSHYRLKIKMGHENLTRRNLAISSDFVYPFAEIVDTMPFVKHVDTKTIYDHFPFRKVFTIVNLLQNAYDNLSINSNKEVFITQALIGRINELCQDNNIKMIVTYMEDDVHVRKVISYCSSRGIALWPIIIDLSEPQFTNQPLDRHPSPIAHAVFAEMLTPLLTEITDKSE